MLLSNALLLAFQAHAGHEMATMPDEFSLFNHHLAGLLVILMAGLTLLEESRFSARHWGKYLWPLPILAVALFVLLRSDAELTWPLRLAVWMPDTEAVQHKIFGLLALALGAIELLRRTGHLRHAAWQYFFILGAFAGGVFLLFHSGVQHSHIVHRQHIAMGLSAIAISFAKAIASFRPQLTWLRLYLIPMLFLALGLQLALYVE